VTGTEKVYLIYTQILTTFSELNFFSEHDAYLKILPIRHLSLEGLLKLAELSRGGDA